MAPFVFLQPLIGAGVGVLVLREDLSLAALLGGGLICVGVALTLFLGDSEATRLLQALGDAVMQGIGTLRNLAGF